MALRQVVFEGVSGYDANLKFGIFFKTISDNLFGRLRAVRSTPQRRSYRLASHRKSVRRFTGYLLPSLAHG